MTWYDFFSLACFSSNSSPSGRQTRQNPFDQRDPDYGSQQPQYGGNQYDDNSYGGNQYNRGNSYNNSTNGGGSYQVCSIWSCYKPGNLISKRVTWILLCTRANRVIAMKWHKFLMAMVTSMVLPHLRMIWTLSTTRYVCLIFYLQHVVCLSSFYFCNRLRVSRTKFVASFPVLTRFLVSIPHFSAMSSRETAGVTKNWKVCLKARAG